MPNTEPLLPPPKKDLKRLVGYMNERLMILVRRLEGTYPQTKWTRDPILQKYKFCNVRRAWDRTTSWLIEHWYTRYRHDPFVGMACATARFVGHLETLKQMPFFDWHKDRQSFASANMVKFLRARKAQGLQVWTGAYMITNGGSTRDKAHTVVADFLEPLSRSGVLYHAESHMATAWPSCAVAYRSLREQAGFGPFMAQEVVQDMILTGTLIRKHADQSTFAVLGPGARRGLNRLYFGRPKERRYSDAYGATLLNVLRDELKERGSGLLDEFNFRTTLTAHDVEFNLCEFDKYERTRLGQGTPRSQFTPSLAPPMFPNR